MLLNLLVRRLLFLSQSLVRRLVDFRELLLFLRLIFMSFGSELVYLQILRLAFELRFRLVYLLVFKVELIFLSAFELQVVLDFLRA